METNSDGTIKYPRSTNAKTQPPAFGTSFYVYVDINENIPDQPFLIDTGAGVSLLPESMYEDLPADKKPELQPTDREVQCGNEQGIRIRGIVCLKVKIQHVEYDAVFHVSPDIPKGILGANFLESYEAHIHVGRRQLSINNRNIKIYDSRGFPLKHRVVAQKAVYVPPGSRFVMPARILGKHDLKDNLVMVEGVKSTLSNNGILVAKIVTTHENYRVMVEVSNVTDETQKICKNTTLGIISEIEEIQPWSGIANTQDITDFGDKPDESLNTHRGDRVDFDTVHRDRVMTQGGMQTDFGVHQLPPSDNDSSRSAKVNLRTNEKSQRVMEQHNDIIMEENKSATRSQGNTGSRVSRNNNDRQAFEAMSEDEGQEEIEIDPPPLIDMDEDMEVDSEDEEEVIPTWVNTFFQRLKDETKAAIDEEETSWSCEELCKDLKEVPKYSTEDLPEHMRAVFEQHITLLDDEWDKYKFFALLRDHQDIFAKDRYDLGRTDLEYHHIDTGNEPPVRQKPRRLPQVQHEEIENQVRKLADAGIITPSNSNYASNVLLVKKKDQTWRLCIDYRELNTKTKHKDPYLIPRIDDTLDALSGARYFCTLDLAQGYHQVELSESSKTKTAFITPHMTPSLWEFTCMPFGITGGPATFQRVMDRLLTGMAYKIALAYLDDIIVYGMTFVQVMNRLARVFDRIRKAGLKLKPKKCTFFQKQTLYLGHVVAEEGVSCDPEKIEKVKTWPRPRNGKQALGFAGFCNYYNRFIKNFSELAKPLYALGPKKAVFKWGDEEEQSFQKLKQALISAPVMAFPTPTGDWILDTDASGTAMGAVLSQMQPDENGELVERVVAYGSKTLQGRQRRYCTRRRELLAVVHFVDTFRPYLYGRFVTIRTDHASLKYLKTLNNPDDQFARWLQVLEETYYKIEVRKGSEHTNADAMSRIPVEECGGKRCICDGVAELEETGKATDDYRTQSAAFDMPNEQPCEGDGADSDDEIMDAGRPPVPHPVSEVNAMTINAVKFDQRWTAEQIATAQRTDPDLKLMYESKKNATGKPDSYELKPLSDAAKAYFHDWRRITLEENGVLYRRWETADGTESRFQIILPYRFREEMFTNLHSAINAAHMGRRRTQKRMQKRFYWFRMNEDIKMWVKICPICQRRKKSGQAAKAPLQPMLVGMPNERVAIDIVDHLPESEAGMVCVLMMIDHFSKYAKAVALPDQRAETIATAFIEHWVSIFGTPTQLHTDQGRNFESSLMQELCTLLKIDKTRTTPYHPSGNGQCERQNSTAMNLVHSYARDDPYNWDKHLSLAMMGYNMTKHSATGFEPTKLMIGRNINMPADLMMPADPTVMYKPVDEYVVSVEKSLRTSYEVARERLQKAATAMSNYHDKDAKVYDYQTGDCVKLRVTRIKKGMKFADKYDAPYYVIDQLGLRTFRIAKAEDSRMMVRHHNQLLPYFPTPDEAQEDIAWVYERANILREGRQENMGTQTRALPTINEQTQPSSDEIAAQELEESAESRNEEQEVGTIPAVSLPTQTNISIETSITEEFEVGDRWWEIDNAIGDLEAYQKQEQQPLTICNRCAGRACGLGSRNNMPSNTCELGWREFIEMPAANSQESSTAPTVITRQAKFKKSVETQTEIALKPTQSAREIVLQRNAIILPEEKYRSRTDAPERIIKSCEQTRRQQQFRRTKKRKLSNNRKKEKKGESVHAPMPVLDDDLVVKRRRGRPRKTVAAIFSDTCVQTHESAKVMFECNGSTQTELCM